jgi:alpha-L-rhamnosidase
MISNIRKLTHNPLILSLALTCLVLMSCQKQKSDLTIFDLRCEYLSNPLGINTVNPGLSWKIKSEKNGTSQSAYQLLVASDSSLLNDKDADLWNSDKVSSSASLLVPYTGKQLNSRSLA